MTDFLLRARDLGLYHAITDNGAGGFPPPSARWPATANGCRMDLERAPLKYAGLDPWEILLSEAQERMTLAVPPEKIDRFMELAARMEVEATVLGEFTDTGKFHVLYDGKTVAYLDMEFLHNGYPRMELRARWEPKIYPEPQFAGPRRPDRGVEAGAFPVQRLQQGIGGPPVRPRGPGRDASIKPLVGAWNDGPGDAAVLRPLLDSWEGVVVSSGICPRYSDIDTYHMMACAIDEAIRNNIAVGGNLKHMAGLDNFCWCDPVQSEKTPDGEYKLAQLVRANMALYDYTTAFGVPCISGKDSMKNDYLIGTTKISIPPTVLFSVGKRDPRCAQVRHHGCQAGRRPRLCPGGNPRRDGGFGIFCPPRVSSAIRSRGSMPKRPRRSMKRCAEAIGKASLPPATTAPTAGWAWPWPKPPLPERWAWKSTCAGSPAPGWTGMTSCSSPSPRAGSSSRSIRRTSRLLKIA